MRREIQKEIQQWLCRLEETAVNCHVKTRLLDAVRDCKKDLEKKLSPEMWADESVEVDELLEQIKKQMPCETDGEVSGDEIRRKASEMMERCRQSNEALKRGYVNDSDPYIREAEEAVRDLCNVAANYEEVTKEERFLNAVHNIGQKYKMQIDELQENYVSVLHQNYQNLFDRMRELFSSAGYGEEIQRKFYETYYEKLDLLAADTAGYVRNLEKGQASLEEYAKEVQEPIQKTVKRLRGKAARKKWIPALTVLLAVLLGFGGKMAFQRMSEAEVEETAVQEEMVAQGEVAAQEQSAETRIEEAKKMLEDVEEVTGKVGEIAGNVTAITKGAGGDGLHGIIKWGVLLILTLVTLLLLYWLWTKSVDRHCRDRIIKETADLQNAALQEWKKRGTLTAAVEKSFEKTETYVFKRYQEIMMQLSGAQGEDAPEKAQLMELCEEWETIKRKVEF